MAGDSRDIFRREALDHFQRRSELGELLRLHTPWTARAYWLLLGVASCGLLFVALGKINRYASGPAVVILEGRSEVTAKTAGMVSAVLVAPGTRVRAGEGLLQFDAVAEHSELERINGEFTLLLVRTLLDPADRIARQSLSTLRAQRELAVVHQDERVVRAAHEGLVSDIRVRTGQYVTPGEPLLVLLSDNAHFRVSAFLPGQFRPQLVKGQSLRLELTGYRYRYQTLGITKIGDEVIGPMTARRQLAAGSADALPLDGPVVMVQAEILADRFSADGRSLPFYDGMQGRVEVRVTTHSILISLIPALRALFPNDYSY